METTVPSYYTAWPTRDLIMAAHQQITREWWTTRLQDFDIFISQFVLDEAAQGDREAAARRLQALRRFRLLDPTTDALELATALVAHRAIPPNALGDASHIAIAAAHGMHFLLTWNFKHIANAERIEDIEAVCKSEGFECPVICTPEELMSL